MTTLFSSVFTQSNNHINLPMMGLALIASIGLGIALASVYRYRSFYTKEFVITLTILPTLLAIIIFLVNGKLGTSVAVAGAFSLVRFRSAAGGSRELLALFMAMTIGLSTGTGYLALAILSTLFLFAVWIILEHLTFFSSGQTVRSLVIELRKENHDDQILQTVLNDFCKRVHLQSVKSKQNGEQLTLSYQIDLVDPNNDIALTRALLNHTSHPIDVSINKIAKKTKTL